MEDSAQRKACILGKPGKELADYLKSRYKIANPKRALLIGDSLNSDVKFGKMCGFQTMIVLSGGTTVEDLQQQLPAEQLPDYVAESLADFNNILYNN